MLFFILKYCIIALLLAYVTNVLVKAKEAKAQLRSYEMEHRIEAYVKINGLMAKIDSHIAPPREKEELYASLLENRSFKIGDQMLEYTTCFDSFEKLLGFKSEIEQALGSTRIFLEAELEDRLSDFYDWYMDVLSLLYAFDLTESDKKFGIKENTRKEHLTLAARLLGIALQEDINWHRRKITRTIAKRIQNIDLRGWDKKHSLSRFLPAHKEQYSKHFNELVIVLFLVHSFEHLNDDSFKKMPQGDFRAKVADFSDTLLDNLSEDND